MCSWQDGGPLQLNESAPSALASRLPESLEELDLQIDFDQAARVEGYREEMLQSLLSNRALLPNLRRIALHEYRCTQSWEQFCICNLAHGTGHRPCPEPARYPVLSDHRPTKEFVLINVQQAESFLKFKAEFQKKSVLLEFVGDAELPPTDNQNNDDEGLVYYRRRKWRNQLQHIF